MRFRQTPKFIFEKLFQNHYEFRLTTRQIFIKCYSLAQQIEKQTRVAFKQGFHHSKYKFLHARLTSISILLPYISRAIYSAKATAFRHLKKIWTDKTSASASSVLRLKYPRVGFLAWVTYHPYLCDGGMQTQQSSAFRHQFLMWKDPSVVPATSQWCHDYTKRNYSSHQASHDRWMSWIWQKHPKKWKSYPLVRWHLGRYTRKTLDKVIPAKTTRTIQMVYRSHGLDLRSTKREASSSHAEITRLSECQRCGEWIKRKRKQNRTHTHITRFAVRNWLSQLRTTDDALTDDLSIKCWRLSSF